jgi:Zn-dependent peptidase ImmA (M78 family)
MISENIELKAEQVLNDLNIKDTPVPVEEIASRAQIKISRAPSKDFSGLLIRKDGHALIGVNDDEAPVRQRFTIAHELGHFYLHPNKDAFVDYRNHKDNNKDAATTIKERQANMFAAALLMPRKSLMKDFNNIAKGLTDDEACTILSKRYEVSDDAMKFRLKNLGLQLTS